MKNRILSLIAVASLLSVAACKTATEAPQGTWKQGNSGTTALLLGMHWVTPQNGYTVGFGGTIMHTTDGGDTWSAQSSGTAQNLYRIAFADANTGIAAGNSGTIVRTTDGGVHWRAATMTELQNTAAGLENIRDLRFLDANTAIAVGGVGNSSTPAMQGVMIQSVDGGDTWSRMKYGSSSTLYAPLYGIGLVPHNTMQFTLAGAKDQLITTNDGGRTWQPVVMLGLDFYSIDYIDALHGLAVTAQGSIYRTADAGVTWTQVYAGTTELRTVRFVTENEAWAAGADGLVLHSSNGGINWSQSDIPGASNTWNDIVIRDNTHFAFIGNGGALWWRNN